MSTLKDKLAAVIWQRYDECPPGKWPMEDSLAEFIIEHAESAGFTVAEDNLQYADTPLGPLGIRFDLNE